MKTKTAKPLLVRDPVTVTRYVGQVMDLRAALENLEEFVSGLPAPDEDGNIPGFDYGHTGTIDQIHSHITAAMEHADEMNDI